MTPEERFQENQKLVHFILQKKFPLVAFDEDVIQEANMGLWKACIGFDEAKGTHFQLLRGPSFTMRSLNYTAQERKLYQRK